MLSCMNTKCKKALSTNDIVFTRDDKTGASCSTKCCGVYDREHVKQTEIIPRWIKKRIIATVFRATGCAIPKVNVKLKDGAKIPEVTLVMQGNTSVDAISQFSGQEVDVEISRTSFKREPLTDAEKVQKKKDDEARKAKQKVLDDKARDEAKDKTKSKDKTEPKAVDKKTETTEKK